MSAAKCIKGVYLGGMLVLAVLMMSVTSTEYCRGGIGGTWQGKILKIQRPRRFMISLSGLLIKSGFAVR